jgi:hypothetical protein
MNPFSYPATAYPRKHGPHGYADADSFRPWLRDEFTFRCVYCLQREQWGKVRGSYDLDHFLPQAFHPKQSLAYHNLLYSCTACNTGKGGQRIPNPEHVLTGEEVWVNEDGTMIARTSDARRIVRKLGLEGPDYTEFRLLWIDIVAMAEKFDSVLHRKLLAYPADLPDLAALRPPDGNSRPEGVEQSCFARRLVGTLPEVY